MGSTFTLPILLFLLAGLLVLAAIEDARTREIANAKTAAIVLLAPLWWWANGLSPWPDMAIQIGIAAAVFALFCIAFHFGLMGGGDVKLIVALSLWLPFGAFMAMLMVMSIAGGVLTAGMLIARKLATRRADSGVESTPIEVPYGIAIAFAGLVAVHEPLLNSLR
ncbi:prepilin peptidase [Sphingomonas sp. PvP018]|uniref:A24 family peptidase n=1 Tax=Sphingomonas sp. PvP018 TaxID=2817852 RepID=UPI001AE32930|nr:prepilin peptidase [Sphingomonas sp. PvP018]MBP2514717.1 prepilin peptidase CpaA [Sphingomonas sp. PvP018]